MIAPVLFLVVAMLSLVSGVVLAYEAKTWDDLVPPFLCVLVFCASIIIALIAAAL